MVFHTRPEEESLVLSRWLRGKGKSLVPRLSTFWFALVVSTPALGGTAPLSTVRVANELSEPVFVTHVPSDFDRVFIVEQSGTIRILDITQEPPILVPTPFLDITDRVSTGGERGLLGLAFHPDYAANGLFYVNYTGPDGVFGDTRVSQFHVSPGRPNDADVASEVVLLSIGQPQSNHNGGWIAFGPDGYLYIAMGDGGGQNDDDTGHTAGTGNAQDITDNLLGKILRIDVDGDDFPGDTTRNYAVPADNPFAGQTGDDEIWAYGLRNPWRAAFDRLTGDLYIADVGQDVWEEINFQAAFSTGGENWGWRCHEGAHNFEFTGDCGTSGTPSETLLEPIHEFSHGGTPFRCSITGGEVYRGCAIPDLAGTYFFADYCSAQIWSFRYTGGFVIATDRTAELAPGGGMSISGISSFGLDAFGEIYICDIGGEVYKIIADGVAGLCKPPVAGAGDDVCAGVMPEQPCTTSDDCTEAVCGLKNRYISFHPSETVLAGVPAPQESAIRVKILTLPGYPVFEGEVRWAGAPQQAPDENSADPSLTMSASALSCDPVLRDWSTIDLLHVYGGEIVPGASYEVRVVDATCLASGSLNCMSLPRIIATGTWGDVVALYQGQNPEAPQPDFNDIAAVVQKFLAAPTAPIKARAQLQPNVVFPQRPIDFKDIAADVSAFVGAAYENLNGMFGPCTCPSTVTCGATGCTNDTQCPGGFCIDDFCTDACGRCSP